MTTIETCQCCSKSDIKMSNCSACKAVTYCSKECQINDWKFHKTRCFKAGGTCIQDYKTAVKIVLENKHFDPIFKAVHHQHISDINNILMLCLITPNFDDSKNLVSYACTLNAANIDNFSEEMGVKMISGKRNAFFLYHDERYEQNSSKGSMISFDFDYETRNVIYYELFKILDFPIKLTVYLDGRCD